MMNYARVGMKQLFRAKTLLVIGAGASVEVGLPVGADLLKNIADLTHITFERYRQMSGDPLVLEALKIILDEGNDVTKLNDHIRAGWQLGVSAKQALSIDNVIDALEDPKIELIGKLGIARAILKAEAGSPPFRHEPAPKPELDPSKFAGTWYSYLTKVLTEGIKRSEVKNIFSNVEIINFNYDRCLEHYLTWSLASYYGIEQDEIKNAMQGLVVHRPYGVVGRLPWQAGTGPSVGFGECRAKNLAEVAQQIRTFTEQVEEGTALEELRSSVSGADRIIFLGFAFHRQNVELISQKVQAHTEIVATAFGISRSDKSVIEDELEKAFEFEGLLNEGRIELAEMKCANFFHEYWRTITAERNYRETVDFPVAYDPMSGPRF